MNSDVELAARVAGSNDQEAFRILVERHQPAVRGFLLRLLAGDQGSADDLAQETFLIVYQKILSWRSSGSLKSWLHTIAYRQFLQYSKKHSRLQVMAEVPQPGFDPGQAIDAEMLVNRLLRLVGPQERACLTLAYAAGMSHGEISSITSLPLGTVKSHIQRGRQKLQHWLEENDHSVQKAGSDPKKEVYRAKSAS